MLHRKIFLAPVAGDKMHRPAIFGSKDNGETWEHLADIEGQDGPRRAPRRAGFTLFPGTRLGEGFPSRSRTKVGASEKKFLKARKRATVLSGICAVLLCSDHRVFAIMRLFVRMITSGLCKRFTASEPKKGIFRVVLFSKKFLH